jgi:parvulin-like peptidyl-prolyl isomerase
MTFDDSFVRGVFALAAVGDKSPLVRTRFGVHVILMVATQEARQLDAETRRSLLADEIRAARIREALDGLLESLRSKTSIKVERSADDMLHLVSDGFFGSARQEHR